MRIVRQVPPRRQGNWQEALDPGHASAWRLPLPSDTRRRGLRMNTRCVSMGSTANRTPVLTARIKVRICSDHICTFRIYRLLFLDVSVVVKLWQVVVSGSLHERRGWHLGHGFFHRHVASWECCTSHRRTDLQRGRLLYGLKLGL